jgi:hypothetical protein
MGQFAKLLKKTKVEMPKLNEVFEL